MDLGQHRHGDQEDQDEHMDGNYEDRDGKPVVDDMMVGVGGWMDDGGSGLSGEEGSDVGEIDLG